MAGEGNDLEEESQAGVSPVKPSRVAWATWKSEMRKQTQRGWRTVQGRMGCPSRNPGSWVFDELSTQHGLESASVDIEDKLWVKSRSSRGRKTWWLLMDSFHGASSCHTPARTVIITASLELDPMGLIIYVSLLLLTPKVLSLLFDPQDNTFLSWAHSYATFHNWSNCWVCGALPSSSVEGFPWWTSPLQGKDFLQVCKYLQQQQPYVMPLLNLMTSSNPNMDWCNTLYLNCGHNVTFNFADCSVLAVCSLHL